MGRASGFQPEGCGFESRAPLFRVLHGRRITGGAGARRDHAGQGLAARWDEQPSSKRHGAGSNPAEAIVEKGRGSGGSGCADSKSAANGVRVRDLVAQWEERRFPKPEVARSSRAGIN